jgi:hypothetical protein
MKTKSTVMVAFLAIAAIFTIATIAPAAFANPQNSGGQSACNDNCKGRGNSATVPQADAVTSCRDNCGNPISHGSAPQPNPPNAQPNFDMGTQSSNSGGNAQNPTPIGARPQPH